MRGGMWKGTPWNEEEWKKKRGKKLEYLLLLRFIRDPEFQNNQ